MKNSFYSHFGVHAKNFQVDVNIRKQIADRHANGNKSHNKNDNVNLTVEMTQSKHDDKVSQQPTMQHKKSLSNNQGYVSCSIGV